MRFLKLIISTTLFIVFNMTVYGQEGKRNNNWVMGYDPTIVFDFSTGINIINPFQQALNTKNNSCISDTNGNLSFFSSGFALVNKYGQLIDNGTYVNCPNGNVIADAYGWSAMNPQTSIIIPKGEEKYYVFSSGMSDSVANILINNLVYLGYDILNYSVVDMSLNGGMGKVVDKNKVILNNQKYYSCAMTAVKHGNGVDWWLVKADCRKHQFQTFLVKEDTILGPYYYTYTDTTNECNYYSEIEFSDDGTMMASIIQRKSTAPYTSFSLGDYNRVDIFDFDRCSGIFTNQRYYSIPNDTISYPYEDATVSIAFSPNSKLLYMINFYSVYQVDLSDTNTYNGMFIHGMDDSLNVFPSYYLSRSAPNGKLYIGNFDGTRNSMSYIDNPNVKGLGCSFIAKGLVQNFNNNLKMVPNLPNYGLGGNGLCIPATVQSNIVGLENLVIYPNPTGDLLHIKNAPGHKKDLYNSVGQLILSTMKEEIDVSRMAKGLYVLSCDGKVRRVLIE